LLRRKDRFKILRVYAGIAITSLFKVNVPALSQGIRLGAKASGAELDDKIESRKVLGPLRLSSSQELGGTEIL
jgi:hypothetical protein